MGFNYTCGFEDYLAQHDAGIFDIEWIKNEFNRYDEDNYEDPSERVSSFINDYYWGDLYTYGFYDEMNDLLLLNYIKNHNKDYYDYIIEFMEKEDNINYIREKIVCMVFEIKVEELVSLKLI
tara:strand:- start:3565 stop:3930 length:366 start_codon:yes stop_codon:yes gene_type:complete